MRVSRMSRAVVARPAVSAAAARLSNAARIAALRSAIVPGLVAGRLVKALWWQCRSWVSHRLMIAMMSATRASHSSCVSVGDAAPFAPLAPFVAVPLIGALIRLR